jgi:hypothetical protein
VVAPDAPGSYQLELDLLQEHKGWFAGLGSPTFRLPLVVDASDAASENRTFPDLSSSADAVLVPRIEMHVMSREETVAVIEEAGGLVLDVISKDRCGPPVPSFDYVVGRAPLSARRRGFLENRPPTDRPPPLAPPTRPLPSEGLWAARADIDDRAELLSFPLSSRRRLVGPASVFGRGLLRHALREVLYRQTEFNRASSILAHELERQIEQLQTRVEAQDDLLVAANARIESLEARRDSPERGEDQGGRDAPGQQN